MVVLNLKWHVGVHYVLLNVKQGVFFILVTGKMTFYWLHGIYNELQTPHILMYHKNLILCTGG